MSEKKSAGNMDLAIFRLDESAGTGLPFQSRRSPVLGTKGVVSCSQPLASQIGIQILNKGGNAVDAAIAVAASLCVMEPMSTGVGGDAFCIHWDESTKKVSGMNASGRSSRHLTRERVLADLRSAGVDVEGNLPLNVPDSHFHALSVPGAVAGWCDALDKWGTMTIGEVLEPAIRVAENGYPVPTITSFQWHEPSTMKRLQTLTEGGKSLLMPNGKAPKVGEIFKNPDMAKVLRRIAEKGRDGFYKGPTADAIVECIQSLGGVVDHEDLAATETTYPQPLNVNYKGVDVHEIPPNGQGIAALIALKILSGLDKAKEHNSVEHLHKAIEVMRLAWADARWMVSDLDQSGVDPHSYISEKYAATRRKLFDPSRASVDVEKGSPHVGKGDTVQFCVVDKDGNACSWIQSNYQAFGSCAVPTGCGFPLQNRGAGFSLRADHPNVVAPSKRPYNTIIPGLATKDGELYAAFGVMGGFNQPQAHMQVMVNMIDFDMDPQMALDVGRFCIPKGRPNGDVFVETEVGDEVIEALRRKGHTIVPVSDHKRAICGRGQIIRRLPNGVFMAGSDGRADGCAVAQP